MRDTASNTSLDHHDRSRTRTFWRRFRRNRLALCGLAISIAFVVAGIGAPWIAPHDPFTPNLEHRLAGPTATRVLGSDALGRDLLSRIIYGARISLLVGTTAVLLAFLVGVPIGIVAGYYGGWLDKLLMRIVDVMLSFPGILLALLIMTVLGTGLVNVVIAVGVFSIPTFARLTRGTTLSVKELEYVHSAHAIGARSRRIIVRHVLPNVMSPLIVQSTLRLATAILTAAGLSFLGFGAQPPTAEWGAMLSDGRTYLRSAPHIVIVPGVAIMVVVLAVNMMGDGLRDALDPRSRH